MQLHDGAMGTMLAAEVRGDETSDDLCVRAPELVRAVHRDYLAAGAGVIQTNTFLVGLRSSDRRRRVLLDAARECAGAAVGDDVGVRIAATIGPHARDPRDYWFELEYWLERDAPIVRIETLAERSLAETALVAWAEVAAGVDAELLLGCTVAPSAGFAACRWPAELAGAVESNVFVGLNCCEGAGTLRSPLELLVEAAGPQRAWVDPSAGLPPYESADEWAGRTRELIDDLPLRAVGGCCGTSPRHLAQLLEMVEN